MTEPTKVERWFLLPKPVIITDPVLQTFKVVEYKNRNFLKEIDFTKPGVHHHVASLWTDVYVREKYGYQVAYATWAADHNYYAIRLWCDSVESTQCDALLYWAVAKMYASVTGFDASQGRGYDPIVENSCSLYGGTIIHLKNYVRILERLISALKVHKYGDRLIHALKVHDSVEQYRYGFNTPAFKRLRKKVHALKAVLYNFTEQTTRTRLVLDKLRAAIYRVFVNEECDLSNPYDAFVSSMTKAKTVSHIGESKWEYESTNRISFSNNGCGHSKTYIGYGYKCTLDLVTDHHNPDRRLKVQIEVQPYYCYRDVPRGKLSVPVPNISDICFCADNLAKRILLDGGVDKDYIKSDAKRNAIAFSTIFCSLINDYVVDYKLRMPVTAEQKAKLRCAPTLYNLYVADLAPGWVCQPNEPVRTVICGLFAEDIYQYCMA